MSNFVFLSKRHFVSAAPRSSVKTSVIASEAVNRARVSQTRRFEQSREINPGESPRLPGLGRQGPRIHRLHGSGLVYAHLASRIPVTGYAYQWSSRLVNKNYGWFTGWIAFISFITRTAGTAAALGSVFAPEIWAEPTQGQIQMLSIGATLVVCVLSSSASRSRRA